MVAYNASIMMVVITREIGSLTLTRDLKDIQTRSYGSDNSYGCYKKEANLISSELARLREQIELECQALQHLMQFSAVASHRAINRRYRNLDSCRDQLIPLVGEDKATSI